jgi:prepilin-type N-terminal cleavage/methylation domain-containing protein
MYLYKTGFTLAEVLITLLIIGIISSIVIPGIIADTQQAELKTAWKKTYSELSQATIRLIADNGGSLKGVFTDRDSVKNTFAKYLSYTSSCDNNNNNGTCWHKANQWYYLNGTSITDNPPALILSNGSLLRFNFMATNCDSGSQLRCGEIYVDVNGFKKPNTIGKDIFGIYIRENSIRPFGVQGDGNENNCNTSPPSGTGFGCSAKYLYQ